MAANAHPYATECDLDVPLELIIFSCGICQATLPEIYATKESNRGFDSGSSGEERAVTRLWIGECSHIFCGKHLPDGGPPFHPKDTQPRAPCPQCREKGDDSLKNLYGIRGLGKGELADIIPSSWTQCPAVKLDSSIPGMEALRFQYLCLSRYAQRATRHWKAAERKQHDLESACNKERKRRRQAQQQVLDLQVKVDELEKNEAKLRKWEARKPAINHYLSVVTEMSQELKTLRRQLAQLGYQVPVRNYAFRGEAFASSQSTEQIAKPPAGEHRTLSKDLGSSSSRKRKLDDYDTAAAQSDGVDQIVNPIRGDNFLPPLTGNARTSSRALMPPPLPRLQPHQRRGAPISVAHQDAAFTQRLAPLHNVQAYQDGVWMPQELSRSSAMETCTLPFRAQRNVKYASEMSGQPLLEPQHIEPHTLIDVDPRYSAIIPATQSDPKSIRGIRSRHFDNARWQARPPQLSGQNNVEPRSFARRYTNKDPSPPTHPQVPYAADANPFVLTRNAERPFGEYPSSRSSRNPPSFSAEVNRRHYEVQRGMMEDVCEDFIHRGLSDAEPAFRGETHGRFNQQESYDRRLSSRRYDVYNHSAFRGLPQIQRNSDNLFERPHHTGEPQTNARSESSAVFHRDRVTLPPNLGRRIQNSMNQEPALLRIRGVRGAGSQGSRHSARPAGPLYDDPRTLFSAAAGRRSVRR